MEALRKPLLLATVQHSGSRQVLALLGREFKMLHERERSKPGEILFAHLVTKRMEAILSYDGPILTTRRPVDDIRASWIRRGRDLHELDEQLDNYATLLREAKPYVIELGEWRS